MKNSQDSKPNVARDSIRRRLRRPWLLPIISLLVMVGAVDAAFNTTVPVSEQSATDMAGSQFPVSLQLAQANLFLTDPQVFFLDKERIGIRVSFQAYDHRPAEGIAMSETGLAMISARVAYDRSTQQVLLSESRMEQLRFDRSNDNSRHFSRVIKSAWSRETADPVRVDLPPHPYLTPLRHNIHNILYDGKYISIVLVY